MLRILNIFYRLLDILKNKKQLVLQEILFSRFLKSYKDFKGLYQLLFIYKYQAYPVIIFGLGASQKFDIF